MEVFIHSKNGNKQHDNRFTISIILLTRIYGSAHTSNTYRYPALRLFNQYSKPILSAYTHTPIKRNKLTTMSPKRPSSSTMCSISKTSFSNINICKKDEMESQLNQNLPNLKTTQATAATRISIHDKTNISRKNSLYYFPILCRKKGFSLFLSFISQE